MKIISNLVNVETNPGEGYYEIKEIASGGELQNFAFIKDNTF